VVKNYRPRGVTLSGFSSKKLYFNRHEIDRWLQQNRKNTNDEIEREATDYILQNRRR
jgi:hypothetical protein